MHAHTPQCMHTYTCGYISYTALGPCPCLTLLLCQAMAKQNNPEGGESSAPPPPPPPPDHTAASAAPLLMDHVAAAVAALAAPEHAMSLAAHAMVMDLPIATVGAEALASPSTAAAAAMGSAMVVEQMLPVAAVEMQPVEEYPQEPQDGGGEIDITEDSAVQVCVCVYVYICVSVRLPPSLVPAP